MKPQVQRPVLRPPWRHAFLALRIALIAFTLFVHLMWWRSIEQRRDEARSAVAMGAANDAVWHASAAATIAARPRLFSIASDGAGTTSTTLTGDGTWSSPPTLSAPVPPPPRHLEVWGGPVRAIIRCETLDQTRDCAFVPP